MTPTTRTGITRSSRVAEWIVEHEVRMLNVAGNRESRAPGIGDRVERFLADMFRRLGHRPIGTPLPSPAV
jgi:Circularly permutated YpsA SLOG family